MEIMISALAVLVDDNASIDGTLAVRAAALDAAITHMAGDGCQVADTNGNGEPAVVCARNFERYLAGDADMILVPTVEARLVVGSLADAVALLGASDFHEQDDADEWARRRDAFVSAFERLRDQLADRLGTDDAPSGGR